MSAVASQPEEVTPEIRIIRALGAMPYLPTSDYYAISAEPETLARTLESFAVALRRIAAEHTAESEELAQIKRDLAAARRVFGTAV